MTPLGGEPASAELERLGAQCLATATEWIAYGESGEARAVPWPSVDAFRASMDVRLPEQGVDESSLLEKMRAILYNSVNPWTERFLEKLYSAPAVVSILGDMLLGVMNASVHVFSASPILTMIEEQCAAALCERVGYGPQADGITMPGGAASNTLGVQVALLQKFGGVYRRGGVYALMKAYREQHGRVERGAYPAILTSASAHFSIARAAVAAGLGTDAVVHIRTDAHGRMDVRELERMCAEMQADAAHPQGVPLIVCATSGTTVLGAFDDVAAIAEVCRKYDLWLHVDASWGGAAAFLPLDAPERSVLAGLENAHSITINPHKLLGVTHQCSFLLVHDKSVLIPPSHSDGGYLFHVPAEDALDMATKTLGCGRRGDALKFYLVWLRYGTQGLGDHIAHGLRMAQALWQRLQLIPSLELGPHADPLFLQICVRPREQSVRALHAQLQAHGQFAVDYAPLDDGQEYLRLVVHPRTPWHVYEQLLAYLGEGRSY